MKTVREAIQQKMVDKVEMMGRLCKEIAVLTKVEEQLGILADELKAEEVGVDTSIWNGEMRMHLDGEVPPGMRTRLLELSGKDSVLAVPSWDPNRYRQNFGQLDDLSVSVIVWQGAPVPCHKAIVTETKELVWCGDLPDGYEIVEELDGEELVSEG